MSFNVVIPARYASSRLPGKPLLDIAGKAMIQRVYESASQSDADKVIIATDDERIAEVCAGFNASVCMTAASHSSGTDRLQEVAKQYQFDANQIVVNVQGDEPLIDPALINQVAKNLSSNTWASMASLYEAIIDLQSVFNPNNVKVIVNELKEAVYFSRAPIPWDRENFTQPLNVSQESQEISQVSGVSKGPQYLRHIGIYAYRTVFLHEFVTWQAAGIEVLESLEQLRALANGKRIHMDLACKQVAPGVDTQDDLDAIRQLFTTEKIL